MPPRRQLPAAAAPRYRSVVTSARLAGIAPPPIALTMAPPRRETAQVRRARILRENQAAADASAVQALATTAQALADAAALSSSTSSSSLNVVASSANVAALNSNAASALLASTTYEVPGCLYLPSTIEFEQADFQPGNLFESMRTDLSVPINSMIDWFQCADLVAGNPVCLVRCVGPSSFVVEAFFQCSSPGRFLLIDKINETGLATPFGGLTCSNPACFIACPNEFLMSQADRLMRPGKTWRLEITRPQSAILRASADTALSRLSSPTAAAKDLPGTASESAISKKEEYRKLFAAMCWSTTGCFSSAMGAQLPGMNGLLGENEIHTVSTQIIPVLRTHVLAKRENFALVITCSWTPFKGTQKHLNFSEICGPSVTTMPQLATFLNSLGQFIDLLVDNSGTRMWATNYFASVLTKAKSRSQKFADSTTDWFVFEFTDWFSALCTLTHNFNWRDKREAERLVSLEELADSPVYFTKARYDSFRDEHPRLVSVSLNAASPPFVPAAGGAGLPPANIPKGKFGVCLSAVCFASGVSKLKCSRRKCSYFHGPVWKGQDQKAATVSFDALASRNASLEQCALWLANKAKINAWMAKSF